MTGGGVPDIDGKCSGRRTFNIEDLGEVELSHITMTLESDKHLRSVYYTPLDDSLDAFRGWLQRGEESRLALPNAAPRDQHGA